MRIIQSLCLMKKTNENEIALKAAIVLKRLLNTFFGLYASSIPGVGIPMYNRGLTIV